ncbi:hypothetical protein BDK51DRAFT_9595, partial [Blyttiomyces helicus]
FFPNTLVNAVNTPPWQTLLPRIGDAMMTHLLLHTSLFISLSDGCYYQVAGE